MRIFNALKWLHPGGSKRVTTLVPSIAHLSSTINSAGTGIVLTYSLPVVIGAGGSGGHALTVSGGPVTMTYLSGSGTSSLTFSLSRTVAAAEGAGTISYTQPVSGVEEAVFRVDVDSWVGRAVVNNSTAIPPPSLVSATLNAAGSTISLLYSAAVHIGTSGPGGHTMSMSGGASAMTYASGDDTTTLVYSLSRAITIAETGTLAFVQPSNGLEALAGGADLSSFSGFAVVNASTAPPTVLSATLNSDGTSLTITYTSAVRIGAGGNAGHVLTASGGASALTYASGAGSAALVYTLARTVISSETVTLAYTQPTNGVESTTAPNPDVVTYSGRAVTNGSTQVAPTRTSASIPAAGTSISIVYSQNVTFGAGGNGGNVITASGGASTLTYASGSGSNTLVYSLSRTITGGETVTLAYTQPGSGIESVASLADVASFSGAAVTNNVPSVGYDVNARIAAFIARHKEVRSLPEFLGPVAGDNSTFEGNITLPNPPVNIVNFATVANTTELANALALGNNTQITFAADTEIITTLNIGNRQDMRFIFPAGFTLRAPTSGGDLGIAITNGACQRVELIGTGGLVVGSWQANNSAPDAFFDLKIKGMDIRTAGTSSGAQDFRDGINISGGTRVLLESCYIQADQYTFWHYYSNSLVVANCEFHQGKAEEANKTSQMRTGYSGTVLLMDSLFDKTDSGTNIRVHHNTTRYAIWNCQTNWRSPAAFGRAVYMSFSETGDLDICCHDAVLLDNRHYVSDAAAAIWLIAYQDSGATRVPMATLYNNRGYSNTEGGADIDNGGNEGPGWIVGPNPRAAFTSFPAWSRQ